MCCEQNLWKCFTFNIPVSILSALGHILKLDNRLPPKPDEGQRRGYYDLRDEWAEGWGWQHVDGQRETRRRLTGYFGWKQSSSSQWSTKQSVYCEVGLIPGEEEKWFLLTGRKLTLSSLLQGRCWISTYWSISLVGFAGRGLNISNSVSFHCIFYTAVWLDSLVGSLFSPLSSLPPSSTGRLWGNHILIINKPLNWAAVTFSLA